MYNGRVKWNARRETAARDGPKLFRAESCTRARIPLTQGFSDAAEHSMPCPSDAEVRGGRRLWHCAPLASS
jgi:hypothetical protein